MGEEGFRANAASSIERVIELNSTPWRLYVPNQKNQQLLEQAANGIGAQACLSALGINYDVIEAPNTEWMSKNGHVPLLIGQNSARNVASGPRDIREMLTKIGISLRESDSAQRDLFKLIEVIERVELYHSWVDPITVLNVTKKRYTRLLDIQNIMKFYVFKKRQFNVLKVLDQQQWTKLSAKEVVKEFRDVLRVFSEQLGTQSYLFGHRISELDCALFGHLYAILTTKYYGTFGPSLADTIHEFQNLVDLTSLIDREVFQH